MKITRYLTSVLAGALLLTASSAFAISLEVIPSSQSVPLGGTALVSVNISGLGNFAAPSLGGFDLDISFDPTILGFILATYGDPVLGDQLDLFGFGSIQTTTTGLSSVELAETSGDLADDLNNLQAGDFILVTLGFQALASGTSSLAFTFTSLADADGNPLTASAVGGSVTVPQAPSIPEPSTITLLGLGMAGIALLQVRGRRRAKRE